MWDVVGLLKEALAVTGHVLHRLWGDQTSQQANLLSRTEQAVTKKHEALALLKAATENGNKHAITLALSAVNSWDTVLKRLRAEAAATAKR